MVNVIDLMALPPPDRHPHGMDPAMFETLFGLDLPVVFAFHGYPGVVHQLIHGRPDTDRFHVRGYVEEGTTTTPFDMVVLNHMSRIDLARDAVRYSPRLAGRQAALFARADEMLAQHRAYVTEHFEDLPEIRDWTWTE